MTILYRRNFGKQYFLQKLTILSSDSFFRKVPLFIINLERDTQKRKFIECQLSALGITNYSFFKAFDAKSEKFQQLKMDFQYDESLTIKYEGRKLSDSIVALTATHYAIYEHIVSKSIDSAIILEDDALFINKYTHNINMSNAPLDWDICLFEGWLRIKPPLGPINAPFYDLQSYKGGTAAYAITRLGSEKLLSARFPLIHPPDGNLTWYNIHAKAKELSFAGPQKPLLNTCLHYPFPVINGSLAGYWKSSCDGHWVGY
jgi:GR25 family glycosyltransferase involved in LPS biosynthesis